MKSIVFLALIFLSSFANATEFSPNGVVLVKEQEMLDRWNSAEKAEILEKLNQAHELAIKIVEKAASDNPWTHGYFAQNRIYHNLATRLKRTQLNIMPPDSKNRYCAGGNVLDFAVNYVGKDMNVCPIGLFQSPELMAQIFIHEGAHLVAGGDECKATVIETVAMLQSDTPVALANGYWEKCKTADFIKKVQSLL